MRHGNTINHLSRTTAHRKALLNNLAIGLILHKRIFTTLAKAKELRRFIEPLVTKCKVNTTHSRRVVFSYLQNKKAVHELFETVAPLIMERPGGYTRIVKLSENRSGDNAEMAMIELVDFNLLITKDGKAKAAGKTRRSRRGSGTGKAKTTAPEATDSGTAMAVATAAAAAVGDDEAAVVSEKVTETPAGDIQTDVTPAADAQVSDSSATDAPAPDAGATEGAPSAE